MVAPRFAERRPGIGSDGEHDFQFIKQTLLGGKSPLGGDAPRLWQGSGRSPWRGIDEWAGHTGSRRSGERDASVRGARARNPEAVLGPARGGTSGYHVDMKHVSWSALAWVLAAWLAGAALAVWRAGGLGEPGVPAEVADAKALDAAVDAFLAAAEEEAGERAPATDRNPAASSAPAAAEPGRAGPEAADPEAALADLRRAILAVDAPAISAAIESVVAAPHPDAVPLLGDVLDLAESAAVRGEALRALELIGSTPAARRLLEVARSGSPLAGQARVRLSRIGNRDAQDVFLEALEAEQRRGDLAAAVVRGLGRMKARRAVESLVAIALDGSGDPDVRLASADALGEIADPLGLPGLEAVLRGDDARLRRAVIRALAKMPSAATRAVLEEHAKRDLPDDERDSVRDVLAVFDGQPRSPLR